MEMESSRRSSLDRSREPGLKKPRLGEEAERDLGSNGGGGGIPDRGERSFLPPRAPLGAVQPLASRIRANERERDARDGPFRGASYNNNINNNSNSNQQQQMQELVAQYKTALAELTFNSKPIITNLTIIAGENLHAAKGIASAIFANILEVPSEQKLPSLYLLDSIVKNIGRDYIKYFAGRLPEVFCKAYKQVDPSIHSGMRHLFGTWRGVFPPAPLQIIEKELGFPPFIDVSSSGATTSRPDSQAKRPPNSIHVNPKYLEARQRFQQPTQVKEGSSDDIGSVVTAADDAERPDRAPIIGGSRLWDSTVKNIQRPRREFLKESAREKSPSLGYGDHEFTSDYSQHLDLGIQRVNERVTERDTLVKPWYGLGATSTEGSVNRKTGLDTNHAYGNSLTSRSTQPIVQLTSKYQSAANKSNQITSQNWKNSEEEEYMWDDMHSRSTDQGWTDGLIKRGWNPDDAEKPASFQRGRRMTLETENSDGQWNKLDAHSQLGKASGGDDNVPSFKEIRGHLPPAHGQHDTGLRIDRELSADSLSIRGATFGHRTPAVWSSQEPLLPVAGLAHTSTTLRTSRQLEDHPVPVGSDLSTSLVSSLVRTGLPHMGSSVAAVPSSLGSLVNVVSELGGFFGKKTQQEPRPVSPSSNLSASSASLQHQSLHSSAGHDHLQPQRISQTYQTPIQLSGQSSRAVSPQVPQNSFPIMPPNHNQQSHTLSNLQQPSSEASEKIQISSVTATPFAQLQPHLSFLQQLPSDLSVQHTQPSVQTQDPLPPPQTGGLNGTNNLNSLGGDILNQPSTSNLLAAIMKSGLLSNSSASSLQNPSIQPPLPSGPPPAQVLTVEKQSAPLSSMLGQLSHDCKPTVEAHPPRPVLPPLPPGPPPPSSLVGGLSQVSNTTDKNPDQLSSLLSSLVAKGLISSPAVELSNITSRQMPNQLPDQSADLATSASIPAMSTSASTIVPPSPSSGDLSSPKSFAPKGALSKGPSANLKDLIGIEFKPEIIRECHPLVINELFDDLKHQCLICGLRFRLQQQLKGHLTWHALKKPELGSSHCASQKWYVNLNDWIVGSLGSSSGSLHVGSPEQTVVVPQECEPMVPADESQSICALCGEPFDDFYCEGRDEWMYKGTVYMNHSLGKGDEKNLVERGAQGVIVHDKCMSRGLTDDMEAAEHDNLDQADG